MNSFYTFAALSLFIILTGCDKIDIGKAVEETAEEAFGDKTGQIVINPQFDDAKDFSEGLAAVEIGNRWGFIDKQGTFAINPQFDWASSFFDGIARVSTGDSIKYIDKQGNVQKIHTGFTGPGTGKHYKKLQQAFNETIKTILED